MNSVNTLLTAIGTLIVAWIGYLSAMRVKRQDVSSENISQSRQEWRLKLRKIAVKDGFLNKEDYQQILGNINSYYAENSIRSFFMRDQHIKNAINNIEDNVERSKIVKEYLRLLLKYDWDRSKCEIMGASNKEICDNYLSAVAAYSISFKGKGQEFARIFKGTGWSKKSVKKYALSLSTENKKFKTILRNMSIYIVQLLLLGGLAYLVDNRYYYFALIFAMPSLLLTYIITYFTKEKIIYCAIVELWSVLAICVMISGTPNFDLSEVPANAYGLAACVGTFPFIVRGSFYTR